MNDIALSELLASRGFHGAGAEAALDRVLAAAFARHCPKAACRPAPGDARTPVRVAPEHCETCGGSDNRRAVEDMLAAMRRVGWTRLLVAGGSPGTRGDLERLCRGRIELRFVTEDTTPNRRTVGSLLAWSDIAVIWVSTEIAHKATAVLRGAKVLNVHRRGVAALADAVRDRCGGSA